MKRFALALLLALTLILAACAPQANPDSTQPSAQPDSAAMATPTDDPAVLPTLFPNTANASDMTRMDEQGAVIFEVTPLNLTMEEGLKLITSSGLITPEDRPRINGK